MGGRTTTWKDEAEVWAAVWPISANEVVQAAATTLVVSHRIRMRWRDGVSSTWRIKFGDRYFAIVSLINQNEMDRNFDLMCREAAA